MPDLCGPVGEARNGAAYIMLPVDPGCELDRLRDGTAGGYGWGVFSGTSAAAPQLAGVCALLLVSQPRPEIRSVLRASSRDVILGKGNPASNADQGGMPAGISPAARPAPAWSTRSRPGSWSDVGGCAVGDGSSGD